MKEPWLSPSQWARAWEVLYWPGPDGRQERLVDFFRAIMAQVLDALQDIPSRGRHEGEHRYVDAKDLYEKFSRFSLETGRPDKAPLAMRMEKIPEPIFDSTPIQPKVPALKFFRAPKKRRRKP